MRKGGLAVASRQHLRSATGQLLVVPRHRHRFYDRRAFCVAGLSVWNSLPDSLRNPIIGGNSFRQSLKTFLFATYWCIQRIRGFTSMRYINRLFTYLLKIIMINDDDDDDNDNNNSKTMFMVLSSWQSHCESSPGSFDECRTAPSGCRPKTKPDDLGCESACTGCESLHPRSPFIIFTQPESWYSFYRPTEGRRLSRPRWLVTYGEW